jgi:hypothetical protein
MQLVRTKEWRMSYVDIVFYDLSTQFMNILFKK